MNRFKTIIAQQRKSLGLTQEALANLLNITPQAVSKWECGRAYPDVTLLPDIARALNISIDELLGYSFGE